MKNRYHVWGKILILLAFISAVQSCYRYDPIRDKLNRRKESQQPTPTPQPQPEEVTLKDIEEYYAFDKTQGLDAAHKQIEKITDEREVNGKRIRIPNAQIKTEDRTQGLLVLEVEGSVNDQSFSNSYTIAGFKKEEPQPGDVTLEHIEEYYAFDKTQGLDAAKQKIEQTKDERLVGGRKIRISNAKVTFEDKEQGMLTLKVEGMVDGCSFSGCYTLQGFKKEDPKPAPVTLQDIEEYYAFDKTQGLDVAKQKIEQTKDERLVGGRKIQINQATVTSESKEQGMLTLNVEGVVNGHSFSGSYTIQGFKKEEPKPESVTLQDIEEYYAFDKTQNLDVAKQKIEQTKDERLVGGRKIQISQATVTFEDKEQGMLTLNVEGTVNGHPFSGGYTIQGFKKEEPEPQPQITTYKMDFEAWENKKDFQLPVAPSPFPKDFWASGSNEGFYLILIGKQLPYPVTPLDNGYNGRGARIQSRPGKVVFGFGSYLVAGSLFNGSVLSSKLASKPLEAVQFGTTIELYPMELRGKFRYAPGPKYIDGNPKSGKEVPGAVDQGVISVVFYEVNDAGETLNGTNLYTSLKIVSIGKLVLESTDKQWKDFSVKVVPTNQERFKTIDLKNKKYKVAIVFSSSIKGDQYLGAVESTLDIDEVELVVTDMPDKVSTKYGRRR